MPSAISQETGGEAAAQAGNQYDDAVEDFLDGLGFDNDVPAQTAKQEAARDIDEEVTVRRKRKPRPKLDENLLLSSSGIPKLRKITKTRLQFRGKGHEFTDIGRLLDLYQLWMDDMYTKAKFKDAQTLIEKVGHSRRMQVTRRAWLDETKPVHREQTPDQAVEVGPTAPANLPNDIGVAPSPHRHGDRIAGRVSSHGQTNDTHASPLGAPEVDELDELLAQENTMGPAATIVRPQGQSGPFEIDDDPDEDELDALLAEQEPYGTVFDNTHEPVTSASVTRGQDNFADDEEAMMGVGGMW